MESEGEEYGSDSDIELQEAFAKGLLKPGLNTVEERIEKKFINNVRELKQKLSSVKLNLPWIERLDLVTGHAPMAPEMAYKLQEQELIREKQLKNKKGQPGLDVETDPILNDFRREMLFHRQAQAAVLDGIARLKALGVSNNRPEDYFAQMAKSDDHMQKVREALMRKQHATQRSEKVRQVRQMRKVNKQLQAESRLKRERDKKELMDEVKKFRQKKRADLDFLDDKKKRRPQQALQTKKGPLSKKAQAKRNYKDKKFGFGGKKRFLKANTKSSSQDVSEYRIPVKDRRPGKERLPRHKQQQRPGKNRRIKQKTGKKRR